MRDSTRLRIVFVGPMLGRHPGIVPNPMETLVPRLEAAGYQCLLTSSVRSRYLRLGDMLRTIVQQRPRLDLLCLQVYSGSSIVVEDLVSWLGRKLGLRIVMVLHGGALPGYIARHPRWSQRIFQRAQVLISPSAYLAESLALYGFRVRVIPNYIDLDNYPFRLRTEIAPNLLWMRTYHSLYNPAMAIKVAAQLQRLHPDVRLTMAGQDKGLLPEMKDLAAELGLADRVRFAGFLDSAGKQHAFAAHDIFLNTNRVDNMPISVVEAAAFGLPIVATAVGGVPYLLSHEETGLLVEDDDVDGMARAVLRLLGDPELVRRLSVNGRQLAKRSSWPEVLPLWEQAWRDALQD